jgi:hypothetical protein
VDWKKEGLNKRPLLLSDFGATADPSDNAIRNALELEKHPVHLPTVTNFYNETRGISFR